MLNHPRAQWNVTEFLRNLDQLSPPRIIIPVNPSDQPDAQLLSWLRLTFLRGVGPVLVKRLLETLQSPEAILQAHPATLAAVDGIGTIKANQIVSSAPGTVAEATAELLRAKDRGISLIPLNDIRYPPALRNIPDPPLLLYVRGELLPNDAVAIGMVGARKCTLYGREQAQRFGAALAERGLTIVSGGARGIDTSSHLGALQAGGRTIVVMGCGINNVYPPENDALYDRIVNEKRGAIISELPFDAPPSKENFPPRNRIIAGMTLGIVVVEANLQSGSLITARLAAADYGREVFALPGRVDSPASAGTHHLIKTAAAHLVESADDVLEYLGDVGRLLAKAKEMETPSTPAERVGAGPSPRIQPNDGLFSDPSVPANPQPPAPALTPPQQQIITALGAQGASIDELVDATQLKPQVIIAELTLLQIQGRARRLHDNRFAASAART
jgi:DNA processing protein